MSHPSADDLASVPLFADLSHDELEALAAQFDIDEFDTGRTVFKEGQAGYAFYVIASGRVVVSHDGEQLADLGAGDFFGEIAILGEGRRTATVTVSESAILWVLFGTVFRTLQAEQPEIASALEGAMRARLA